MANISFEIAFLKTGVSAIFLVAFLWMPNWLDLPARNP